MIDPITLGLVSRGVMGAGQMIGGLLTRPKNRPKYRTPSEITEATNRARVSAGATTDDILQNDVDSIERSGSNAVSGVKRTATNASDVVGSMGQISGQVSANKMQANRGFAQRKQMNEGRLDFALDRQASFRDKEFQYNENEPYQEKMDTSNMLMGAGIGNLSDGVDMATNQAMIKEYGMQDQGDTPPSTGASGTGLNYGMKAQMNGMINRRTMNMFGRKKLWEGGL